MPYTTGKAKDGNKNKIEDTIWHYKRDIELDRWKYLKSKYFVWKNRDQEKFDDFFTRVSKTASEESNIVEDDLKERYNLLLFQDNYHRLNKRMRNITFIGILGFLSLFITNFILYLLGLIVLN